MKTKRGKSGTGLRDYVKKSDSEEKIIKVINKQGKAVFEKKSKVKANPSDYKPAEGSPFRKALKEIMEKREPGGRFSRADIEFAKQTLKKRKGGAMLKNPGKADLDKDGKLSGYEKKRGMAIEKSMSGKKFGGAMKYNKGGGADTGRMGELRSKLAVAKDKFKKKGIRGISPQQRERLKEIFEKKFPKTMTPLAKKEKAKGISTKAYMGGGMMNKPMGYKSGTSVMARGCKLGRKKATKIT